MKLFFHGAVVASILVVLYAALFPLALTGTISPRFPAVQRSLTLQSPADGELLEEGSARGFLFAFQGTVQDSITQLAVSITPTTNPERKRTYLFSPDDIEIIADPYNTGLIYLDPHFPIVRGQGYDPGVYAVVGELSSGAGVFRSQTIQIQRI